MKSGVYSITNTVNGKVYVGSSKTIEGRWWSHLNALRKSNHHNVLLARAAQKYGADSFEFSVLEFCEEDRLIIVEQKWIDILKACDRQFGYNLSPQASGTRGYKWRPESLELLSKVKKESCADPKWRKSQSEKALAAFERDPGLSIRHSEKLKGRKNGPHSAETREKIAASKRGKKRPVEMVARMAASLTGKKRGNYSAEHCTAISAALKASYARRRAETGSCYGAETLQRMSAAQKGRTAWNKGMKGVVKSSRTPEQRTATAAKVWATRRARRADTAQTQPTSEELRNAS